MSREDALVEASLVLAGTTRSHVGAARILAYALQDAVAEAERWRTRSLELEASLKRLSPAASPAE